MLIVGAKGHAMEVLQCLTDAEREEVVFFDDVTPWSSSVVLERYPLLCTAAAAQAYLAGADPRFILGLGSPVLRERLAKQFQQWGGVLTSVVASTALVWPSIAGLGLGLNVMHHTLIAPTASVGEGVLLNFGASIHHDVEVGAYCEVSPGARLLGRCRIGQSCRIGASATILPDVVIGNAAVVGAGAVVTRDVPAGITVIGVPARVAAVRL